MLAEARPKPVAAWRYVIPNAVTSLSLVLGLFVLLAASEGRFVDAGWLMVWCVLLDKLDGTSARLLGATSKFGVQLDSLADLVVFGVAPAGTIMLFSRAEPELFAAYGGVGLVPAAMAMFVVCSALRLAKFNVLSESDGPSVFFGMPTTLAGGLLALLVLIGLQYQLEGLLATLPIIAAGFALLMVSNLPLPKIGHDAGRAMKVFQLVTVALAYVFGFMRIFPEYLLGISLFYALVGFGWGLVHRSELRSPGKPDDDDLDLQPQPS
ncbi:MAG: CDP-alcohol phosphatidyltransferase family protein [Enhygromyxa sp.]